MKRERAAVYRYSTMGCRFQMLLGHTLISCLATSVFVQKNLKNLKP